MKKSPADPSQADVSKTRSVQHVISSWQLNNSQRPGRDGIGKGSRSRSPLANGAQELELAGSTHSRGSSGKADSDGFQGDQEAPDSVLQLLSQLNRLPEAWNKFADGLVEENKRAQSEMRGMLESMQLDLSAKLDEKLTENFNGHRQNVDDLKLGLENLHSKWTEQAAIAQPSYGINNGLIKRQMSPQTQGLAQDRRKKLQKLSSDSDLLYQDSEKKSSAKFEMVSQFASPTRSCVKMPKTQLTRIVRGDAFNALSSVIIVANTIVLGIQTNIEVVSATQGDPKGEPGWFRPVNITLISLFTIELLLRMAGEQLWFFAGDHKLWNIFDLLLVATTLLEEIFVHLGTNFSFFRLFKIIKMMRAIRILRVFRFFRELRMMVCSIISSFVSLTWAFVLLSILIFCTAVALCQGLTEYIREYDVELTPANRTLFRGDKHPLDRFYGSVPVAMYSLVLAISGGLDWYDLVYPLSAVGSLQVVMFVVYTLFVIFGMLNVLTGVFVDRASEFSNMDRDLVVESERIKVENFCMQLKRIFEEVDSEGTGYISWPEFQVYCERDDVHAYMNSMDLAVDEANELFRMLDSGDSGRVNIENFLYGCLRVKGQARSLDVLHIQEDMSKIKKLLVLMGEQMNIFFEIMEDDGLPPDPRRANLKSLSGEALAAAQSTNV